MAVENYIKRDLAFKLRGIESNLNREERLERMLDFVEACYELKGEYKNVADDFMLQYEVIKEKYNKKLNHEGLTSNEYYD